MYMKDDNKLRCFAKTLIIIGALNWGFVGLFEFNLVSTLFGEMSEISRVVYSLVGLSALYMLFMCKCSSCGHSPCKCKKSSHSDH